jgi:hypothetical protein
MKKFANRRNNHTFQDVIAIIITWIISTAHRMILIWFIMLQKFGDNVLIHPNGWSGCFSTLSKYVITSNRWEWIIDYMTGTCFNKTNWICGASWQTYTIERYRDDNCEAYRFWVNEHFQRELNLWRYIYIFELK